MSARSEWWEGSSTTKEEVREDDTRILSSEMSQMSFQHTRHSIDTSYGSSYDSRCKTHQV